jgi:hypothetical protein
MGRPGSGSVILGLLISSGSLADGAAIRRFLGVLGEYVAPL